MTSRISLFLLLVLFLGTLSPALAPATAQLLPLQPVGNVTGLLPIVMTWTYSGLIPQPAFDVCIFDPAANRTTYHRGVTIGFLPPPGVLFPGRCYRWWVEAHDLLSGASDGWSEPRDFCYLLAGGAVPIPLSPAGGVGDAGGGPYRPTFTWSFAGAGKDIRYDLYIEGQGTSLILIKEDLPQPSYTLTAEEALPTDSSLQFWVRAENAITGGQTEWSAPLRFNTLDAPVIEQVEASTSASQAERDPLFYFTHPSYLHLYSVAYDLHVFNPATGQNYLRTNFEGDYLDSDTREAPFGAPLPAGYTYSATLRTRSRLFNTVGAWSAPFTLSIPLYGDRTPQLIQPLGLLLGLLRLTFAWTFDGGNSATRFDLYLYDRSAGRVVFNATTSRPGMSFTLQDLGLLPLSLGHTYEWWMRSRDSVGGGVGPWSQGGSFLSLGGL